METPAAARLLSAGEVVNLPLYELHLLIDTRSGAKFKEGRIASAVSFPVDLVDSPAPVESRRNEALARLLLWLDDEGLVPDFLSPVVVYGDESSRELTEWLSDRLSHLETQPLPMDDVAYAGARLLQQRLISAGICVRTLAGGYAAFKEAYPFLAGTLRFSEIPPLPVVVHPQVMLGSRDVTSLERRFAGQLGFGRDILRALGVTHIVVAASMPLPLEDSDGIVALRCAVDDADDVAMGDAWRLMAGFIEGARRESPRHRVLVQVHGRSRSAACCVAWAMQALRLPWQAALAMVSKCCFYRLDHSLMYIDQLQRFDSTRCALPAESKHHGLLEH